MIPKFPIFKKLSVVDKKQIEEMTLNFPPYSDFNFTSLWSYNTEDDALISEHNGNLIVKFRNYITNKLFYSFIGTNDVVNTVGKLIKLSESESIDLKLTLIPEIVVSSSPEISEYFLVSEDRDNFDYIYSLNEMSTLIGHKYREKRYWANNFIKKFPDVVNNFNYSFNDSIKTEILNTFYAWEKAKNKKRKDTLHELEALNRILKYSNAFDLLISTVYIKNVMIAFVIIERLSHGFSISHFLKADITYKGIIEHMYKTTATELLKRGSTYLNREQDLGIVGLRQSKEQWNPILFLKKYTISSKDSI